MIIKEKNDIRLIPQEIIDATNGDIFTATIMYNRKICDADEIRQIIGMEEYVPTKHIDFPDMGRAVELIRHHIDLENRIAVYGDYDVDGVTATITLLDCIENYTSNVTYHLPDRFEEGYGMNSNIVRGLAKDNVRLIITCDCGIKNVEEIGLARELGIDVVVTDHHDLPEILPNANVLLSGKFLEKGHKAHDISGCGMAYFLTQGIFESYGENRENHCLDLLALSIIADAVPLRFENRYIFRKAIICLRNTRREGLRTLLEKTGKQMEYFNEIDIGMQIAPRINATGRLGSANVALKLLRSKGEDVKKFAEEVEYLNNERKRIQNEIIEEATMQANGFRGNNGILVLYSPGWHLGVLGIVAGKVTEIFNKPTICLGLKADSETVTGSARSIEGINILEKIKGSADIIGDFGGHSMAAGLSLSKERVDAFRIAINKESIDIESVAREIVNVDFKISLEDISFEKYNEIRKIGPFGTGFEIPTFGIENVKVIEDRVVKKTHHFLEFDKVSAVKWFGREESFEGSFLDVVFNYDVSSSSNEVKLCLNIIDEDFAKGEESEKFAGEILDVRNMSELEVMSLCDADTYIYCNTTKDNLFKDRENGKGYKKIVFVSPPINTKEFKRYALKSEIVYISFIYSYRYEPKEFLKNLMEIIKRIVKGRLIGDASDMARSLGVEEGILITALQYIRSVGTIEYSIDEENRRIYISKGDETGTSEATFLFSKLQKALKEKVAYQEFLLDLDVEKFKEYLR